MRWRKKKNGWAGVIENVRPYAENVGSKAGPLVGQAAERVGPMVETAGQRLSGAMSSAAEVSEPYRREAALRGREAWVALCGGDPRQVRRSRKRGRRLMLFGGLTVLAVGAAVAYWMVRTAPPSPWQPHAEDDITTGGQGAEAHDAPESERGGESRAGKADRDARPATPPQQRTSSNSTTTT